MPLDLQVDGERWRAHLRKTAESLPSLVPVVKGNGYGLTRERLAAESSGLGVDTLAVGTYAELQSVQGHFSGDVLVLSPWRPGDHGEPGHPIPGPTGHARPEEGAALGRGTRQDARVIHTVSRPEDLRALSAAGSSRRVVVEVLTSMRRHGMELVAALAALRHPGVTVEGVALHLPMTGDVVGEARAAGTALRDAGLPTPLWVSHLAARDCAGLADALGIDVRPRVGTALWLGDRAALRPRALVLDVHAVARGDRYGYRGHRASGAGRILVVAGGTAHGIGLEAPKAGTSLVNRGKALALGALEAAGRVRSPYRWTGRQLWFAEPPHMHVSMLWLPDGAAPPRVGDELDLDVRFTTTTFDRVLGLD